MDKGYFIGIDEAGRGPWAGRLYTALVVLDVAGAEKLSKIGVTDSKKLSTKKREELFRNIKETALFYNINKVEVEEIDRIGIYKSTIKSIEDNLNFIPKKFIKNSIVRIDGVFPVFRIKQGIEYNCIKKGDLLHVEISAASIMAKVLRDEEMIKLHSKFPNYGFNQHMGYGTKAHMKAVTKYGPCEIHRKSFRPIKVFYEQNTN